MTVVSLAGAFLFLVALSLADRSLLGLAGFLGVALLVRANHFFEIKQFIKRFLVTPYLPFAVTALIVAPFQQKVTEVLWLLSIPFSYVVARLIRSMSPVRSLAFGVAAVGFALETVRVFSQTSLGEIFPILVKITDYHHKNGIAWMVALGVVSATSVLLLARLGPLKAWLSGLSFAALGILLLLSDSVTAVIAGAVGLVFLVLASLRPISSLQGRLQLAGFAGLALVFLGAILVANFLLPNESLLDSLRRSSNLTGRTGIWECYLSAAWSSRSGVSEEALACRVGNLHSSFLEAYLNGGWALAIALLFGFTTAIFVAFRRARQRLEDTAVGDELFALGIAVTGFVIALVESYMFSGFVYMSIVLFMGPSASDWPKSISFPRSSRAK